MVPIVAGLNAWELAALEQLTAAGKSLVLALAVMRRRLPLPEAVAAARLEEVRPAAHALIMHLDFWSAHLCARMASTMLRSTDTRSIIMVASIESGKSPR